MHDIVFNWSTSSVGPSPLRVGVGNGEDIEDAKACFAHPRGSESVVQQNALRNKNTKILKKPANPSFDQSINQSINQSTNQSINQSINLSISLLVSQKSVTSVN